LVARQAHNLKVVGSNPTPATNFFKNNLTVFLLLCSAFFIVNLCLKIFLIGFHPNTDQIAIIKWVNDSSSNILNFDIYGNFIYHYLLGLYGNFTYFFMSTIFIINVPFSLIFKNYNFIHFSVIVLFCYAIFSFITLMIFEELTKKYNLSKFKKIIFSIIILSFLYFSYHSFYFPLSAGHHIFGVLFLYFFIFYNLRKDSLFLKNENFNFYFLYILTIFSNYTNVFILLTYFFFLEVYQFIHHKKLIINKSKIIFIILNIFIFFLTLILIYFYNRLKPGEAGYIVSTYGGLSLDQYSNFISNYFTLFLKLISIIFDGYGVFLFISIVPFFYLIDKRIKIFFITLIFLFVFFPAFLNSYQRTFFYFMPIMLIFSLLTIFRIKSLKKLLLILSFFLIPNFLWGFYPIIEKNNLKRNIDFDIQAISLIGDTFGCVDQINNYIDNNFKTIFLENNIRDLFSVQNKNLNMIKTSTRLSVTRILAQNTDKYFLINDVSKNSVENIRYYVVRGLNQKGVHKENESEIKNLAATFFEYFEVTNPKIITVHSCQTNNSNYDEIRLYRFEF
tara:strand:+ start:1934 stop:3613 length:1680 start_codon:yes stop_codon:yes gene_type:complete